MSPPRRPSLPIVGAADAERDTAGPADDGRATADFAAPAVIQTVWMRILMTSLKRAGVGDLVISPGSRSSPLVHAAEHAGVRCFTIIDERSAGFFALGRVRVSGAPVALVCTSGTAGAHYYPAIIEASQAHLPLLVLTADRPPELQHCASPQTIPQAHLFGRFARHFADVGTPSIDRAHLRALRRVAVQAVAAASAPIPGPVHLNVPARKPLEPAEPSSPADIAAVERADAVLSEGPPRVMTGPPRAARAVLSSFAHAFASARAGVIACGPLGAHHPPALAHAVWKLAAATGFPLLAEATSQLRFAAPPPAPSPAHDPAPDPAHDPAPNPAHDDILLCDGFDALLSNPRFRADTPPELIIQIGPPLTSKGFASYLSEHPDSVHCVIAPWGWNDAQNTADALLVADPVDAIETIASELGPRALDPDRQRWRARFRLGNELVWRAVAATLDPHGDGDSAGPDSADTSGAAAAAQAMREGRAIQAAVDALPRGGLLMLGNSLPIRTTETYCRHRDRDLAVLSQRGANGIDGLISAAAGAAHEAGRPTALILGDVSFMHDLGGLAAARLCAGAAPLAIVVIDNRGGRIFEQLPVAASAPPALFESHWLTPPGCDVQAAAATFGHAYEHATTPAALTAALTCALSRPRAGAAAPGCTIIHVAVAASSAARDRAAIDAAINADITDTLRAADDTSVAAPSGTTHRIN
ncbi:MAG: 2-succinyl-5-enolpyruvyl-6-hydroxy-3-cyclohexene-1-carboxylic-acid synthase [Haliangiales bacterium]